MGQKQPLFHSFIFFYPNAEFLKSLCTVFIPKIQLWVQDGPLFRLYMLVLSLGCGLHQNPRKPHRPPCKPARGAYLESPHGQGTSKERIGVDVGTLRPAYSRNASPGGLCLTGMPCFYPQCQGGSIKHYGNVYKLQRGPLLWKQGWRIC